MRFQRLFGSQRRHRVVTAVSALALIAGVAGTATSATAGPLPIATSTTLYATIAVDAQSVLLQAQVKVLNLANGLGVTPKGTVHFSDDQGDNLGTFELPGCLLKPCIVSDRVPASAFSDGVTRVTATYSGDILVQGSTGPAPVGFGSCGDGGSCLAYTEQPGADVSVSSDSTTGYVIADMGGAGLPCGVNNGGPVATINAYNLDSDSKDVYYMLTGAGAEAYANQLAPLNEGRHWFCYVSPDPFQAYSQDGVSVDFPDSEASYNTFDWAPQIGSGPYTDMYVGLLGDCPSDYDGPVDSLAETASPSEGDGGIILSLPDYKPCIENWSLYQNSDNNNIWELSVYLSVPPGDPYLGGLKLPALPKLGGAG